MSNCCDRFVMIEGENDSFETWQGLRGPYYIPSVSEDGTLSWTNNGDLQNPAAVNIKGPPGPGGIPGGTTGQLLAKASDEDYDTEWIDQPEMDAGHVSYDSTETYSDGTVGKELGAINSALTSLSAVTEIIDTASGAIASFPDGAGLPMRSLLAQIEPKQDLHGYDAPWAGGAGKNLINQDGTDTSNGYVHNAYINSSGNIATASGAWDVMEYVPVEPNTTYTISGTTGSIANGFVEYDSSKTMVAHGTASTIPFTFTTGASTRYVRFNRQYSTDTQVQLEKGSSATTWTPYANVCPITGWTGLSGVKSNGNLFDPDANPTKFIDASGNIVTNGTTSRTTEPIYINSGITKAWLKSSRAVGAICIASYDKDNHLLLRTAQLGVLSISQNIPSGTAYVRFAKYGTAGEECDLCANFGDTATEGFPAYTGTTITCTWQTEAGTVYDGYIDVVSGELVATHGVDTYDGSSDELWTIIPADNRAYISVPSIKTPATNSSLAGLLSNEYKEKTYDNIALNKPGITARANITQINVFDTRITSEAIWRTFLASYPLQVVYPLATPQTYQLTPQQIETLIGNNTVFVDTGSVSVTYQASIKGYIDKVLGA